MTVIMWLVIFMVWVMATLVLGRTWGCKHEWVIVDKVILPSAIEQLAPAESLKSAVPWVFKKKYTCILQCKKCGKLNKTVESNP